MLAKTFPLAKPGRWLLALVGVMLGNVGLFAADTPKEKGTFRFDGARDEACQVPECYRLASCEVGFELIPRFELRQSGVLVSQLTFPSPVTSEIPENNTVHAEYFRPTGPGPFPGVIVLDILDGKQLVGRGQAVWLAQHGVAALVVHMAHYGPRRPPGSSVRLLSTNVPRTLAAIRQTVLDCRCAVAWLASRPEIRPDRLGIVGTSLGSFVSALTAASEPKLSRACLLLTGGGLVDAYFDHPKALPLRPLLNIVGKSYFQKMIAPADPITYAAQLREKKLLIVAARRDEVVPPAAAQALWEATGRQTILWLDATHLTAALRLMPMMQAVLKHITE